MLKNLKQISMILCQSTFFLMLNFTFEFPIQINITLDQLYFFKVGFFKDRQTSDLSQRNTLPILDIIKLI